MSSKGLWSGVPQCQTDITNLFYEGAFMTERVSKCPRLLTHPSQHPLSSQGWAPHPCWGPRCWGPLEASEKILSYSQDWWTVRAAQSPVFGLTWGGLSCSPSILGQWVGTDTLVVCKAVWRLKAADGDDLSTIYLHITWLEANLKARVKNKSRNQRCILRIQCLPTYSRCMLTLWQWDRHSLSEHNRQYIPTLKAHLCRILS